MKSSVVRAPTPGGSSIASEVSSKRASAQSEYCTYSYSMKRVAGVCNRSRGSSLDLGGSELG